MGIFSNAAKAALTATSVPPASSVTMQTVFDQTQDISEQKRIARIGEFFGAPLSTFSKDLLAWFDANFPPLKEIGAEPLPGADRQFWTTQGAYKKWREVVRRRIRTSTGEIAGIQALRSQVDGWTPLLALLDELSKDHGPVHPGQRGGIVALSDRARAAGLNPKDLTPENIVSLLEQLAPHEAASSVNALRALGRLRIIASISDHLPADYDTSILTTKARTEVPENVRSMITEMVTVARYKDGEYDDISETTTQAFNAITAKFYEASLIAVARAAAETGTVDLKSLNCVDALFSHDVRRATIRHWIDLDALGEGISARSAADYVRNVAQIGKANGLKTKKWKKNLRHNTFLKEGHASGERMSPKNQRFCERLIHNPKDVRTFLRQHILYQDRANDILATDRNLTTAQLRNVRRLGTCAAFSALEIRGAGMRKGSALAIQSSGTDQNLYRRKSGVKKWFELRIAKQDMKGEYVEMPPIPIRDDKFCGYEVLDWYIQTVQPLFNFANPEFCEKKKCAMAPHLFLSEKSDNPLRGSTLHRWIRQCSSDIGLSMHPHNFRHGFATLLLARSWANRGRAAAYLGCSVGVLDTYYGWIDKQQKIEETQDILAEALTA